MGGLSARTHRSRSGPVLAHVISHDLRRCTQGRRTEETTRLWFKYPAGGIFQVKLVKCRWPYGRSVLPAPPADLAATRSTGLFPRQLRLPSCVFGEVPGGPVREIVIQIQICGAVTFSLTIDISHLSESPCPTPRSSSFCISKSPPSSSLPIRFSQRLHFSRATQYSSDVMTRSGRWACRNSF